MAAPTHFPFLEHEGPLAFAHRGGALEAPENTMLAFGRAVEMGYRYLETDVYATADGVLLAFHDDQLDRVTQLSGLVREMSYTQIAAARIGGREPIPLFADILAAWPDVRVNVDPKEDAAVGPLIATIREFGAQDRICVGSFSDKRVAALREAFEGRLCTSLGPRGVALLAAAAYGLPVPNPQGGCVQVPVRHGAVPIVTPRFLAAARRAGLPVHVWTIDEEADMERLLDLGVDGLMTDRPSVLKAVLQQRGQWEVRA
ncbi:MAG: glycerophosphodiester phosphodiesterase [Alphaproteobacteria bacterium]|nr:glycerophosphodiester phosphodiesterase [Alphaproteobacteria bacterium]